MRAVWAPARARPADPGCGILLGTIKPYRELYLGARMAIDTLKKHGPATPHLATQFGACIELLFLVFRCYGFTALRLRDRAR